jgi:hypothetical protein
MVVWVYAVAGKKFAEFIAHPKTRYIPKKIENISNYAS